MKAALAAPTPTGAIIDNSRIIRLLSTASNLIPAYAVHRGGTLPPVYESGLGRRSPFSIFFSKILDFFSLL